VATDLEKKLQKSILLIAADRIEDLLRELDDLRGKGPVYDMGTQNIVRALRKLEKLL
jgi:hypothetical protein